MVPQSCSPLPHIAHLIPYLGRAQGGPVFGLASCVKALADVGCDVQIFTVRRPADGEQVAIPPNVPVTTFDDCKWGSFRRCSVLDQALAGARCEIVHSHGLWTDVHRSAAAQARKRGLPHLLAPCGMLAPGALRRHWWKKAPARLWFQDRALREAQCLHAKSQKECEDIRRFGLRNPVAVIPNPISLPPQIDIAAKAEFRRVFHIAEMAKILLFLGRLHPVKGLPRLIQAWARIQTERKDWVLVLAGPDEGGHRRELESLVAELGCQKSVKFTGELDDVQKWGALAASDLFVMPSDFENFGNAIVEAMLSGLPVITTTGTPWQELPAAGAGSWIEPTVHALASTLRETLEMPEEERREMGCHALKYSTQFRPEKAAAALMQVYQWLLGTGPKPGCVVLRG
jgi:glycosyltransferase involved in cell wall biosynthesis